MSRNNNTFGAVVPPLVLNRALNTVSLYYVILSENHVISHITKKITPSNSHSWVSLLPTTLIGKNNFRFVDGSIFIHIPDSCNMTYDAWERCNNIVHSWIINIVQQSLKNYLYGSCNRCSEKYQRTIHSCLSCSFRWSQIWALSIEPKFSSGD